MRHIRLQAPRARRVALAATAATALALAAGCQGSSEGSAGSGGLSADQSLQLGLSTEPPPLITGAQQGAVTSTLETLIHRGLMAYDSTGELVGGLAESYEQPTEASYLFTLREGLTFSDGSPVTAENVKSSLEYYANPASNSVLYAGLQNIESIEAAGNQVTVTLAAPSTAFLQYLAAPMAAIVPEAALNPKTPNHVGAGPFEITSTEPGVGMVLTKFDGYYSADDVTLDEIEVSFYPDSQARTNALISGDVEMIDYVPWENFDAVSNTPGLLMDAENGPYGSITFNVTKAPFDDPRVRQAVAMAINRPNTVSAVYQGHGAPLDSVVMLESDPAYNPDKQELFGYDVEKAKELLAEAGHPDGISGTILATSQYSFLQDTALAVQADLAEIGIDLELDAPDYATRIQKGNAGDFDLAVAGDAGIVTDPSYLGQMIDESTYFNKSFGYSNETLSNLIAEGLQAPDDAAKQEVYTRFLDEFARDVPFVPLNVRAQGWGFQDHIEGFTVLPGFLSIFSGYSFVDVRVLEP